MDGCIGGAARAGLGRGEDLTGNQFLPVVLRTPWLQTHGLGHPHGEPGAPPLLQGRSWARPCPVSFCPADYCREDHRRPSPGQERSREMSNSDKAENSKHSSPDSPFHFRERRPRSRAVSCGDVIPAAALRACRVRGPASWACHTLAPLILTVLGGRMSQPRKPKHEEVT